jgi:hypothetical protein
MYMQWHIASQDPGGVNQGLQKDCCNGPLSTSPARHIGMCIHHVTTSSSPFFKAHNSCSKSNVTKTV